MAVAGVRGPARPREPLVGIPEGDDLVIAAHRDHPVELDQRLRRFGADLLDQQAPEGLVVAECLGAPARQRERAHQLLPEPFAVRVGVDGRLQQRDRRRVLPVDDQPLRELLERRDTELGEPSHLDLRPLLVRELRVGLAVPQREGFLQDRTGDAALSRPGLGQELLEPDRVDARRPQLVPRRSRDEHVGSEHPSQAADRRAQRPGGQAEGVLEEIGGNDRVGPHDQDAHQPPLGLAPRARRAGRSGP